MVRVMIVIMLLFSTTFTGRVCRADDAHEAAAKAFEEGVQLFNQGSYDRACPLFDKAYSLRPSWKLWYNIAQCQAALKNYGVALDAFDKYLVGGGDELETSRTDAVMTEMVRLYALVAELSIKGPDGAQVFIDGRLRGELPGTPIVRITAGKSHQVEIRKNEKILLTRDVTLGSKQRFEISVLDADMHLEQPQKPQPKTKKQTTDEELVNELDAPQKNKPIPAPVFWSGVGVTAALAVATGVTGIVVSKRLDSANRTQDGSAEREELSRAQTVGTALVIATGIALVVTAVLSPFTEFGGGEEEGNRQSVTLGPGHVGWKMEF